MVFDPNSALVGYEIVSKAGDEARKGLREYGKSGEKRYQIEKEKAAADAARRKAEAQQAVLDKASQLGGAMDYDQLAQLEMMAGNPTGAARILRLKESAAAERERVGIQRERAKSKGGRGGSGTGTPAAAPDLRISDLGLPPVEPLPAPGAVERKPATVAALEALPSSGAAIPSPDLASAVAPPPELAAARHPLTGEPIAVAPAAPARGMVADAAGVMADVSGLTGAAAAIKRASDAFASTLRLATPDEVPPDVREKLGTVPPAAPVPENFDENAPRFVTFNERPGKPKGSPATPDQERLILYGADYQERNPTTGKLVTKHKDGLQDIIKKNGGPFTSRDIRVILARDFGAAPGPNMPENLVVQGDKVYVVGPDGRSAAVGNADALFNVLKAGFEPSLMVTEGAGGKLNVQPFPGSQKRGDEYAPEKAAATVEEAVAKDLLSALRASGDIMNDKGQAIADLMVQSLPANVDRKLRARLGKVPEGMVDRIVAAVKREYGAALAPAANTGAAGGAYIAEGTAQLPAPGAAQQAAPKRYTMDELRKGLQALPRQ